MALRKIHAFGHTFDIEVARKNGKLEVAVKSGDAVIKRRIENGAQTEITL